MGGNSRSLTVFITWLFIDGDSKPEIIQHPEGHEVLLGQNVSLRCVVTQKNHTIRVNWTKNNKPLTGAYIITHAQVNLHCNLPNLKRKINALLHTIIIILLYMDWL